MIKAIIQHLVPKPYRLQLLMSCAKRIGEPMDKDSFVYKTQEIILPQRKCIQNFVIQLLALSNQDRPGDDATSVDECSSALRLHPCTKLLWTPMYRTDVRKHSPKQHRYRVMTVMLLKSSAPCSGFLLSQNSASLYKL